MSSPQAEHDRKSRAMPAALTDDTQAVPLGSDVAFGSWMVPVPGLVHGAVRRRAIEPNDPLGGSLVDPETDGALARLRGRGQPLPAEIARSMGAAMGADLDSVRIHTGEEPARLARSLQATAFTLGTDVYFGAGSYAPTTPSGQRLLAHELAHTVQQGSGCGSGAHPVIGPAADPAETEADRVADGVLSVLRQRTALKDSDESGELDTSSVRRTASPAVLRTLSARPLGAVDAPAGPSRSATQPPFIQRKKVWKVDNHPDNYLDGFVAALNDSVKRAAVLALDPESLPDTDGYLMLWKDTAVILAAIAKDEIERDDEDEVEQARAASAFGSARYGYAVESLACGDSVALNGALPANCSYQLQAARGMTRPDVVVSHAVNGEIAWLDITSSGSVGHIDRKTGSGWRNKRYVAEITYAPLDPTRIGISKLSIGERVTRKNAIKRRVKAWQGRLKAVRRDFDAAWNDRDGIDKNRVDRQNLARQIAGEIFDLGPLSPIQTKSLLRALSFSVKDYGFDTGGTKSEGENLIRAHFGV